MATRTVFTPSLLKASDEVREIFCEPCEQDGRQIKAGGLCADCQEYLCALCFKNHKLSKAFRNHSLLEKDEMIREDITVSDTCRQKCILHPKKVIEYICGSCDLLGCSACMTLDHRQCKHVNLIPDILMSRRTNEEMATFIEKINRMCEQISENKYTVSSYFTTTDKWKNEAKSELMKLHVEIKEWFDGLETKMNDKIEEIDKHNKSVLKSVFDNYDSIDRDLRSMKNDVEMKQKTGKNCEAFIAMKNSKLQLEMNERVYYRNRDVNKLQKIKVSPSSIIEDMMKKTSDICKIEANNVSIETETETKQQKLPKPEPTRKDKKSAEGEKQYKWFFLR